MKLIHVIPITRGISKERVSYFSAAPAQVGMVITVPLRKKTVPAIIVGTEEIENAKATIKRETFSLKKATGRPSSFFLPEFVRAATEAARTSASSTGSILSSLTSKVILEALQKTPLDADVYQPKEILNDTLPEKLLFQAGRDERISRYKSLIREEFARGASVFILVPTIADAEKLSEAVSKGIEEYSFFLHGSLTKKELLSRFTKAATHIHPVLIIATSSFLSIPRTDIRTIVVEKENSQAYKERFRPFIDFRDFAELLAKEMRARLILADLPLRIETLYRHRSGEFDELAPLSLRIKEATGNATLIDMRENRQPGVRFSVFGSDLLALITQSIETGERIVLFSARKGLAPVTVCGDCESIVACHSCSAPVVLYKTRAENIFVCGSCGTGRSAKETCATCTSWKLTALGVGIQRVHEELEKAFPAVPLFTLDRDSIKTHKDALRVRDAFYETPGSVLLGTEMALPYLQNPAEHVAVVSLDSLLSLPEWRVNERIFSILVRLRSIASRQFLVQTRQGDRDILTESIRGNLAEFYRREIAERKEFSYPPFSVFVKISCEGKKEVVRPEMEKLQAQLGEYDFEPYSNAAKTPKGTYVLHGLLKISKQMWPDERLLETLSVLPPQFSVDVSPDTLL